VDESQEARLGAKAEQLVAPERIRRTYSHPDFPAWTADRAERLAGPDWEALTGSHPGCITRGSLELSSRCNLKCIYCHQNWPESRLPPHRELSPRQFSWVVEFLRDNGLSQLAVTGGGETTFYPGWSQALDQLLGSGCGATMTTNLAKKYSQDELETLLRFERLEVSLDSLEPEAMARIRKGTQLSQIVLNIVNLRLEMQRRGQGRPVLCLAATIYAEMMDGFESLLAFAHLVGIKAVNLQDFVNYGLAEDNVTSLWSLRGGAARARFLQFDQALAFARSHGLTLAIDSGLRHRIEAMRRFLAGGADEDLVRDFGPNPEGWTGSGEAMGAGADGQQTRDCTDPWDTIQIFGNAKARPCCFHEMEVGPFDETRGLTELWNGEQVRDLRRRLLTGELDNSCRQCNMKQLVPIQALRRKVVDTYFS